MADITFNCPHCGQVLEAPGDMIGETISCPSPSCARDLIVPATSQTSEALPSASLPSSSGSSDNDYPGLKSPPLSPPAASWNTSSSSDAGSYTPPSPDSSTQPEYAAAPTNEPVAIASLVTGILSWVCCCFSCFGIPLAIAAIATGHTARKRIAASDGQLLGDGLAKAGMILGYVSLTLMILQIVVRIVFAILGIAAPDMGENWARQFEGR